LGAEIKKLGLKVPSVIGLWNAIPGTMPEFELSLKETRRRMRMAHDIGAEHIQTIPNTLPEKYNQKWVADRYRDIIEIGMKEFNIKPALVFVKYFTIKTLGQAVGIAMDANHPNAMVIPDVYHMYISDGGFEGLKMLKGDAIAIFQFNDAPNTPAFKDLRDEHRVYPGDGILPLASIFKDLKATGYKGFISLEMYNPNYYKEDLLQVAKTGLRKTLEVLKKAGV
jgi:sugar phosphate isomerase/epimerase